MSDQLSFMIKLLQQRYKANTLLENVRHDVPNFDLKDHCIVMNYPDFNGKSQQKFGSGDHEDELQITENVSDPIDIGVDVAAEIKIALTTNIKLKSFLNESVVEPIHFLAKIKEVPTKETEKFILFSFDNENKARVNRAS
ncbi:hypothetical protein PVK06_035836 [Gossypium arboreum]|uniref:Uncharacterized protein n=1 Tax=Gossypium arboreum TaxID=29729 RepID=A0ABR0NIU3_GOSAR|nr:hypothetical protein PVK06_035836 [Gossypium arboreum]